jgi:uncharacterized protein YlxP (DUF503 family)
MLSVFVKPIGMARTSISERRQIHRCKTILALFCFCVLAFTGWTLLFNDSIIVSATNNVTKPSTFICGDTLIAFNKVFRMDDGSAVADCRSAVITNILATIQDKWNLSGVSSLGEQDDSVVLEILFLAVLGHDFDNIDLSTQHTTIVVDSHTGLLRRNNSMDRHRMVALEFMVIIALLTLGYIWIQDMHHTKTLEVPSAVQASKQAVRSSHGLQHVQI